jgi:hypothetical protein
MGMEWIFPLPISPSFSVSQMFARLANPDGFTVWALPAWRIAAKFTLVRFGQ